MLPVDGRKWFGTSLGKTSSSRVTDPGAELLSSVAMCVGAGSRLGVARKGMRLPTHRPLQADSKNLRAISHCFPKPRNMFPFCLWMTSGHVVQPVHSLVVVGWGRFGHAGHHLMPDNQAFGKSFCWNKHMGWGQVSDRSCGLPH